METFDSTNKQLKREAANEWEHRLGAVLQAAEQRGEGRTHEESKRAKAAGRPSARVTGRCLIRGAGLQDKEVLAEGGREVLGCSRQREQRVPRP